MEVYADIRRKVDINPVDVIKGLIKEATGTENVYLSKDGNKYYCEDSMDDRSTPSKITKKKYDYIVALKLILKNLA